MVDEECQGVVEVRNGTFCEKNEGSELFEESQNFHTHLTDAENFYGLIEQTHSRFISLIPLQNSGSLPFSKSQVHEL